MTTAPSGCSTIGPIFEFTSTKLKFIELCKIEGKSMGDKIKDMIHSEIKGRFPDYVFPDYESKGDTGDAK